MIFLWTASLTHTYMDNRFVCIALRQLTISLIKGREYRVARREDKSAYLCYILLFAAYYDFINAGGP